MNQHRQPPEISVLSYKFLARAKLSYLITLPSILMMVVPALLLDLTATLYQAINLRAYDIPKVNRSNYIFLDRYALQQLNFMEKFFCVYCGYFNGVMQYVSEIAARTEEFWCPIKHSRKAGFEHGRYSNYLEPSDTDDYHAKRKAIRLAMKQELRDNKRGPDEVNRNPG